MSKVTDEMMAIADNMEAIAGYGRLISQYNEVLANGKKLAAYIVKTDEEMENLKVENKRLLKCFTVSPTNSQWLYGFDENVIERVLNELGASVNIRLKDDDPKKWEPNTPTDLGA